MSLLNLNLNELIGNKTIRTQLQIALGAAKLNNSAMGHMLLTGLAGHGKTTMAKAIADQARTPFFEISPDALRSAEDLASVFAKFPSDGYDPYTGEKIGTIKPPIIFIDEAHRLTRKVEEMLGIAMENRTHTYAIGKGRRKQTVTDWVPDFSMVCATTKEGELSKPFRDRFPFTFVFSSYSEKESKDIILLHSKRKGISIDSRSVEEIAKRGRGTPRTLVSYLERINECRVYLERKEITIDLTLAQLELQQVDPVGLSATDIIILKDLYHSGLPKGLDSLAVKTNLDPKTVSEVNEPYLIRLGLLERSKSGRVITEEGEEHLIKYKHVDAPVQEITSSRTIRKGK